MVERVVAARGDWRRLLADRVALDRLICNSGGHLRDWLRLVGGVLTLAQQVPVPATSVDAAIDQLRTGFLPIADNEALWLAEISRTNQISLSRADRLPVLARFLDSSPSGSAALPRCERRRATPLEPPPPPRKPTLFGGGRIQSGPGPPNSLRSQSATSSATTASSTCCGSPARCWRGPHFQCSR